MKKLLCIIISLALILNLSACAGENVEENLNPYFDGLVISDYETWFSVRVTNAYDSGLETARFISVSKDVISKDGCPELEYDEIVRIVFNGDISDDTPNVSTVFSIYKDKAGIPELEYFAKGGEVPYNALNGRTRRELTEAWGEPDGVIGGNAYYDLGGELGLCVNLSYDVDRVNGIWVESTEVFIPAEEVPEVVPVEPCELTTPHFHGEEYEINVIYSNCSGDLITKTVSGGDVAKLAEWFNGLSFEHIEPQEVIPSQGGEAYEFEYPLTDCAGFIYSRGIEGYICFDGENYRVEEPSYPPIVFDEESGGEPWSDEEAEEVDVLIPDEPDVDTGSISENNASEGAVRISDFVVEDDWVLGDEYWADGDAAEKLIEWYYGFKRSSYVVEFPEGRTPYDQVGAHGYDFRFSRDYRELRFVYFIMPDGKAYVGLENADYIDWEWHEILDPSVPPIDSVG